MNPGAMKTNEMKNRAADVSFIRPAADAGAPVETDDLSRFEGEGGLEAPVPATVGGHAHEHLGHARRAEGHAQNGGIIHHHFLHTVLYRPRNE